MKRANKHIMFKVAHDIYLVVMNTHLVTCFSFIGTERNGLDLILPASISNRKIRIDK